MYKRTKTIVLSFIFIVSISPAIRAQFSGGIGAGSSMAFKATTPLGTNIYKGGIDDGITTSATTATALGTNIYIGGIDDGEANTAITNAPLGTNIFKGGNDDGVALVTTAGTLGVNIFTGGNDDGEAKAATTANLGSNIYKGGADDGWAMAFISNTLLPVTIVTFEAAWQQSDALLRWQSAQEINTAYYEIERSFDAVNYTALPRVTAAGESSIPRNYQYKDLNVKATLPAGSNIYYRLRTTDKDGKQTLSAIVVLTVSASNIMYAVFPNPARDFVTISAGQNAPAANTNITLADASGKTILQQPMRIAQERISVAALASGTYFLQITNGAKSVYTQKIIILK